MNESKLIMHLVVVVLMTSLIAYGTEGAGLAGESTSDYASIGAATSEKWTVQATPYFWAPSIKGDATVAGTTVGLDMSFSDIIDDFDVLAFMSRVTARKGNWELIFDGFYIDLETSVSPRTPVGTRNIHLDIDQANADFGLGYRLFETPIGDKAGQRMAFVPYSGLRYAYLKQRINIKPGPTLGRSEDWVEPFIGAQLLFDLSERLSAAIYSDFGGFGIGSASKLTWNLGGGIDYRFGDKHSLKLGYRVYDIDYTNGSGVTEFGMDMKFQGPWVGLTFHF